MHVLTFDVEEWFHLLDHPETRSADQWRRYESRVASSLDRILGCLRARKRRATFFFLGWVAEKNPELVTRVLEEGHEIGSHSFLHQLVYQQDPASFERDLVRSLEVLSKVAGKDIVYYRAPGFSIVPGCEWVFSILVKNGIKVDCSLFPAKRAHGGYENLVPPVPCRLRIGNGELLEMPLNTASVLGHRFVFSGGGYFRLLPAPVILRLAQSSPYVMSYFHPRDFDPGQPVVPGLSYARRLRTYVGLSTAMRKLDSLLAKLPWSCVGDAVEHLKGSGARELSAVDVPSGPRS